MASGTYSWNASACSSCPPMYFKSALIYNFSCPSTIKTLWCCFQIGTLYLGRPKHTFLDLSYSRLTPEWEISRSLWDESWVLLCALVSLSTFMYILGSELRSPGLPSVFTCWASRQPPQDVYFDRAIANAKSFIVCVLPLYIFSIQLLTFPPFFTVIPYLANVNRVTYWNWLMSYGEKRMKCCCMA